MKKSLQKVLAIVLCAVLLTGTVSAAYAIKNDNEKQAEPAPAPKAETKAEDAELSKDETVYVIAGADGAVKKIIVSDWIKNALGADTINDKSELSGIENVKGEETYTINGENARVWDAQGNDIYYQGNIEKELPVNMAISYTLDGKAISPEELAGKSGHVVICFDYQNNQYETVKIDGKNEKIYVPFVMLTGMLLDTDVFTNVDVSNGKLINDGDHMAVVGIALPGLQENLGIDRKDFEISDYVEITADVQNFQMEMTMTVATNEPFSKLDSDKLNNTDDLTESLNQLGDAMNQLASGSSDLYDGLCTLLEKSDELVSGINQLASGAGELKTGAGSLSSGAQQLQAGAASLSSGLNTLASNNDTLNGGAYQVFQSLLATANSQIAASGLSLPALTMGNYADVLTSAIASLDESAVYQTALSQVTAAVEANRQVITDKVTEAVETQVKSQVTSAVQANVTQQVTAAVQETVTSQVISQATGGMTKEEYDAAVAAGVVDADTQATIDAAIAEQMGSEAVQQTILDNATAQMASDEIQTTISAKTAEQMTTEDIQNTIAQNVEAQVQQAIADNMASDAVQGQLAAASEGAKSLISLKTSLDSYNAFYSGLIAYTNGVAEAASGAGTLKTGTDDLAAGAAALYTGTDTLYGGISQMQSSAPALIDGITQLRDGSMRLSEGLQTFNDEGVQKLLEAVDGDLGSLLARLRATIDVSKNYKSFAGISEDMDGQVKFIFRMESIG